MDGEGQERSPDLVPDDLRVHPVDAGLPRSRGRSRRRRAGARRRAAASVHFRLRAIPCWRAASLATRLTVRSGPCGRPARAGRRARVPDLDGRRGLSARSRRSPAGRFDEGLANILGGMNLYEELQVAPRLLALPAVPRCTGPRPGRSAFRRAPAARHCDRDPEQWCGLLDAARAAHPQGRPPGRS